jgi:hypothetical protein
LHDTVVYSPLEGFDSGGPTVESYASFQQLVLDDLEIFAVDFEANRVFNAASDSGIPVCPIPR